MGKKPLLFSLCCLLPYILSAQLESKNWHFGMNAGIRFNSEDPVAIDNSKINSTQGCSSISDSSGNTLFYTNGESVWNSSNNLMANGTNIGGNEFAGQSSLILKKPGSPNTYYLFTTVNDGQNGKSLRYSEIQMTSSGGTVTEKNMLAYSSGDKLTAVKNATNTGYWLATCDYNGSKIICYSITNTGVNMNPIISETNFRFGQNAYFKFSPNGKYLATAKPSILFAFDDRNGQAKFLHQFNHVENNTYGVEFSSDNSKVYFSTSYPSPQKIIQYDLKAKEINYSRTTIFSSCEDGYPTPCYGYFGALQLGLNGKIYFAKSGAQSLGSIEEPNKLGLDCNFKADNIYLEGKLSKFGLPNFEQSQFNRETNEEGNPNTTPECFLFPNPFSESTTLAFTNCAHFDGLTITIMDAMGKVKLKIENIDSTQKYTIGKNLNNLYTGIYFYAVSNNTGLLFKGSFIVK